MPSISTDLLRKLIDHALGGDSRLEPDEGWLAEATALLPENQPDLTYALRQHADEPVPSALFIRDATNWTRPLTRTD